MNNKFCSVAITCVIFLATGLLPVTVVAGPKKSTPSSSSSSSTSSSRPASTSSRQWGNGSSTSSSTNTRRTNSNSSNWGNSTATSRPADDNTTAADKALAAKAKQTGAYGKSRGDAFRPDEPTPAPANASSFPNTGNNSYPVPQTYNSNRGYGPAPVVIYQNQPAGNVGFGNQNGYQNNGRVTGYVPPVAVAAAAGGSHAMLGLFVILIFLAAAAFAAYVVYKLFLSNKTSPALAGGPADGTGGTASAALQSQPHSEGTSFDPHLSGDWNRINPGALITLSDPLSGLAGKEFAVSKVGTLTELDGLARWHIFHFEGEPNLRMMVTTVDQEISMYRLEATDVEPATRQGLLDQDLSVFFMKPEDENNFDPVDLRYTMQFDDWESADKKHVTTYVQKGQGEMHGEYIQRPAPSGDAGTLDGTIVEYAAAGGEKADTDHPYLVILETGGLVETFLGSKVLRHSEVRVENV